MNLFPRPTCLRRLPVAAALVALCLGLAGMVPHSGAQEIQDAGAEDFAQGQALFERGSFGPAAGRFGRALAAAPGNSRYAQFLGRALGLQARDASLFSRPGLASRSRAALERAVALDGDNVGARSDLAAFYAAAPGFMGGGLDKARAQVEEIRRRDPYLGAVRAGDLLLDTDRFPEAERQYLAAVRLDARRPEAHGRLGYIFQRSGRYAQSFAEWDALLALDPANPRALFALGTTADLAGERLAEGEAALGRFLQRAGKTAADPDGGPTPARAHYRLGNLLAKRGERAGARAEYETALRLDPKLSEARQALGAVR